MTTDILFANDADSDVEILSGDFRVDESDQQHIKHIMTSDKGQFRQWPLIGVGIIKQQNGSINRTDLKQTIRVQLKYDEFTVKRIDISTDFAITIDAKRNEHE